MKKSKSATRKKTDSSERGLELLETLQKGKAGHLPMDLTPIPQPENADEETSSSMPSWSYGNPFLEDLGQEIKAAYPGLTDEDLKDLLGSF